MKLANHFFKKLPISVKIVIFFIVVITLLVGSTILYIIQNVRRELINENISTLQLHVDHRKTDIENQTNEISHEILALSETPPIQGIIRAKQNNGYDIEGQSSYEQWIQRLEAIFIAELNSLDIYTQIRYIDENGDEMVRVNNTNGKAIPIPEAGRGNKKAYEYFKETSKLSNRQIYVSKADLNKEGNPPIISTPYLSVLRYSTPIYSEDKREFKGMLVANINVEQVIKNTADKLNLEGEEYIADINGFYIKHPLSYKEWSGPNDLNTGYNIFKDFPFLSAEHAVLNSGIYIDKDNLYVYTLVEPDLASADKAWVMLRSIPTVSAFAAITKIIVNNIAIGLLALLITSIFFIIFVSRLLLPLKDLITAAKKIGDGKFNQRIKVKSSDEIGELAEVFNNMAGNLDELYKNLEKKVKERTLELESEQQQLTTIIDGIGDGVFVIDEHKTIKVFNKMAEKISGYTIKEAIGKPYHEILQFVDEETGEPQAGFIHDVFKSGKIQTMPKHVNLITKNGMQIPVADSAAPLKGKNGKVHGAVIVFRDITLEHSVDKAKTEFVSLASHQLRAPLTAIHWNAELLLNSDIGKLNKQQRETAKEIFEGTERMTGLVKALLNVSRIELGTFAIEPEDVNLKDLINIVLKEQSHKIEEKDLTVNVKYTRSLKKYSGDKKLLLILFQNLISNATKYNKQGGSIDIAIKESKTKNTLTIQIKDSGIGIPKEQQANIYEKLFRADNTEQTNESGTGLGLYIVKAIVTESEGTIEFSSVENKGTTFTITLPLGGMKPKEGSKPLE